MDCWRTLPPMSLTTCVRTQWQQQCELAGVGERTATIRTLNVLRGDGMESSASLCPLASSDVSSTLDAMVSEEVTCCSPDAILVLRFKIDC